MESARAASRADLEAIGSLATLAEDETRTKRGGPSFLRGEARTAARDGAITSIAEAIEDPEGLVVVGCIDDVVVGVGSVEITDHSDGTRTATIRDLFVHPEARRVGVGEAMVEALVTRARTRGCIAVDSYALPGDRATKNFFETHGFTARLLVVHSDLTETDG